ncbi:MAG: ATPase domain-containing protein [Hyphomicrobiaceae bacterium]
MQDAFEALDDPARLSTGITGLDDILGGGLDPNSLYLLEGKPGTGKTTLGLQFLLDGVQRGEKGLYITLSETERELRVVAARHGWSLDDVLIYQLMPAEATFAPDQELTVFHPVETELSETTNLILDHVRKHEPVRIVFDSLSELRLLAQSPLRYRRQILAFKHFFAGRSCTVLLLDDLSQSSDEIQLHSISHGVVLLEQLALDYGAERRRLRVSKMRGIAFRGGYHDFTIERGGLRVFPRLIAAEHHKDFLGEPTSSGNAGFDAMLGGGLHRGTSTLLIGGAGVGKSTVALSYAVAMAERGERTAIFAFDEGLGTIFARAHSLGIELQKHFDSGLITLRQIDPAEMAPGEFASIVRDAVEQDGARMVVIDSLNGYLNAMPDERFLVLQMHELLSYLNQLGVITIIILAQHGLVGVSRAPVDVSYLSDNVIQLRYFEAEGMLRRAISVVKMRSGAHETTIREFQLRKGGLAVGPPLRAFRGIFSGTPTYEGGIQPLMSELEDPDAGSRE